jgi:phage/plasmid primase-like uncharacterized protein
MHHTFSAAEVKAAATGRWPDILSVVAGIPADVLDGRHHPCPRCGGTDRFSAFADVAQTGGVICRKCHNEKNGDGFSTIQWMTGCDFAAALRTVAEYIGISPANGSAPPTAMPRPHRSTR